MTPATDTPDYYAVLGVAPDAPPDALRRAYGERARETMSDRARFEALGQAWETLKDETRRAAYDAERAGKATPTMTETSNATLMMPPPTEQTAQMPPGSKTMAWGGERTQAVVLPPCPVCQTPGIPGEEFCVECGFLVGSVAGGGLAARPLPRLRDETGREWTLKPGENTVGREGADIMLADKSVSRRHARLVADDGGVFVEDTGSTNGTKTGGQPLVAGRQVGLSDGDRVQFGAVKLTVVIPDGAFVARVALPAPAPDAAPPLAALPAPAGALVKSGGAKLVGAGGEFALITPKTTVGRKATNTLAIAGDGTVSGSHAELVQEEGQWLLKDTGSTNGTRVNGRRLPPGTPQPLADGDEIAFGQTVYTFHC